MTKRTMLVTDAALTLAERGKPKLALATTRLLGSPAREKVDLAATKLLTRVRAARDVKAITKAFDDVYGPLRDAHTFGKNLATYNSLHKKLAEHEDSKKVTALLKLLTAAAKSTKKLEDEMRKINRTARDLAE